MGARAVAAGLPPELPVMAGITESSLTNLETPAPTTPATSR